ncbi:MAG: WecB/TagA/CpsF family glycosyltransferase [Clostridiales bacterium]|jgi:N-acetylglucosaminyldiphosphoundecaprenol N-acetyl-beta-D-mannosaminyltransferase|nr:WecB/TagA/CpsF family glycosyltransferase [Clostridiales bacterium]
MKTHILGVPVDNVTRNVALARLLKILSGDRHCVLLTPNPEMVMAAQSDEEFMKVFYAADLVVPDGIGIVLASRLNRVKIKERVAGCDLVQELLAALPCPASVYLLGGRPGVCEKAAANIESRYKNAKVCGFHHGYFDQREERQILIDIQNKMPDILLVGLGFPKQEKWIYDNRELPVKLSAAIGGTLDILAGTAARAPESFRRLGLEWFYRLLTQPSRIGRMFVLPVFALKVLLSWEWRKNEGTE